MVNSILEFSLYVLMYHAALMMMLSIFYNSISKARGFFKYLYNSIKVENSNYTYIEIEEGNGKKLSTDPPPPSSFKLSK